MIRMTCMPTFVQLAAADQVASDCSVSVCGRWKSIVEVARVNRTDRDMTLAAAIAVALRLLARIATKSLSRVHTLGVLAHLRGAAFNPQLYDGPIYRITTIMGVAPQARTKLCLYRCSYARNARPAVCAVVLVWSVHFRQRAGVGQALVQGGSS